MHKNRRLRFVLYCVCIILELSKVHAQENNIAEMSLNLNIQAIALVDFAVEGEQVITYGFSNSEPNQVEQVIIPELTDKTWINYSSIVNSGSTNYITVHISSGTLPADAKLEVSVGEDAGAGAGATGTSNGIISLSTFPQNIITNIGSCYTGVGINKGHQLTYTWENIESYNYSVKYENGMAISVTYTITTTE
jgi:hypothetical protein